MRRGRRLRLAVAVAALAVVAWLGAAPILTAVGEALTVEDAIAPVDIVVLSLASARADAFEAADLYRAGVAPRIVLCRWQGDALDEELERLGVPWLPVHELAAAILRRRGVPPTAVQMLDTPIDGLNTEIAVVADFAHATRPASVLYVTAPSHTRRARWLLRRLLPEGTVLRVRGAVRDGFSPENWWRSRDHSREVAMEYLRWANTFGLRDLWGGPSAPRVAEAQR
jgi:uncharacterized SAM-binding protein YcdF (DUF218 family)